MAASSPVISNNSSDTGQIAISAAAASFSAPPKSLRGLNKPKLDRFVIAEDATPVCMCVKEVHICALISHAKVAAQELKIHAIFMRKEQTEEFPEGMLPPFLGDSSSLTVQECWNLLFSWFVSW
ncbi:hypothetical protein DKX38_001148 [Salix brachista]|uniref:Uncharacterized protein n=1 Tax=Salix brachista TaxID=2182728 RepID=A0A5N5P2F6_9ROSI|nr:hypothetical protein DKX38_001148 [Salix brachista]